MKKERYIEGFTICNSAIRKHNACCGKKMGLKLKLCDNENGNIKPDSLSFLSSAHIETILVLLLSGFSISVFFTQTGIEIFGLGSLFMLLVWRYSVKYTPSRPIPNYMLIAAGIYFAGLLFSAFHSSNSTEGLRELKKFWSFFIAGLLFTCPISETARRRVIQAFFLGACLSGLMGIAQYFGILIRPEDRAHGFTHPIHYAAILAFAFVSALVLLSTGNKNLLRPKIMRYFLLLTIILSLAGIIFSLTRGVWIALFLSSFFIFSLYNFRRVLVIATSLIVIFLLAFSISGTLRARALSVFTSIKAEDEKGSTGNRIELWKGALIMFRKNPVVGTGSGDFEIEISRLISEGRIKSVPVITHAHNIFLHTMATQGLAGLITLVAFFYMLLRWGVAEIKNNRKNSGYIIIVTTLLTVIGGLTENNIGVSKYIATYCLTVGLIGGYAEKKNDLTGNF